MTVMQIDRCSKSFRTRSNSTGTARLKKAKSPSTELWQREESESYFEHSDMSSQVNLQHLWEALVECIPRSLPEGVTLNLMPPQIHSSWVAREYLSIISAFADILAYAAKSARLGGRVSLWLRETSPGRFHVGISTSKNALGVGIIKDSYSLYDLASAPSRANLAVPCIAQKMIFRLGGDLRLRNYGDWGFTIYILLPKQRCQSAPRHDQDRLCQTGSGLTGDATWSF